MSEVSSRIRAVNRRGEAAFIPYLMAGDPSPAKFLDYVHALAEAGADLIELGVPFSDPVADGPTIQAAGLRALKTTRGVGEVLNLVRRIRGRTKIPLILMSYYNPILQFGEAHFFSECDSYGVDGVIVPDLPLGEAGPVLELAGDNLIETPLLVTPATKQKRLSAVAGRATGFLYLVARPGTTGAGDDVGRRTTKVIESVQSQISGHLPVCVGFGLSSPDRVARVVRAGADGAIVGSAIVKKVGDNFQPQEIRKFAAQLKEATRI